MVMGRGKKVQKIAAIQNFRVILWVREFPVLLLAICGVGSVA